MHQTCRLVGGQLNVAVALALEVEVRGPRMRQPCGSWIYVADWNPSALWEQGGPLIDRFDIVFERCDQGFRAKRYVRVDGQGVVHVGVGPTRLVAAMRAIVLSKLGEQFEIKDSAATRP